ncbi:MAG: CNNM domain-containing protein [Planctomycetota bacterium]
MAELIPLVAVLPFLLFASGLASGSETALFSLSHGERARLRRDSPRAGAAIDGLLARPRSLLIFVLLLNMSVNVSYFVVTSVLATKMGGGVEGTITGIGSVLAIILFGEVLAKMLARAKRVAFCRVLGGALRAAQLALGPVILILDRLVIAPLARLVGGGRESRLAAGEVAALIRSGGEGVTLSDDERRVLEEVVALGSRNVRDVMKPRVRLSWVEDDATPETVRAEASASGRTALAVRRGGGEGPIVGLLHVKPFLAAAELGPMPALLRYCDEPAFVPETARLDTALEQVRRRGAGVVFCVDEYGEVSGWLEPEDIADELLRGLGEDDPSEGLAARIVGLGRWWIAGTARLHEVERHFGLEPGVFDSARATTVGGLLSERLGRVPSEGDAIEAGRVRLCAVGVVERRVEGVELTLLDTLEGGAR